MYINGLKINYFINFIYLFLLLGMVLLLPNLFILIYLLFRYNFTENSKKLRKIDSLIFIYYAINYSVMLASRPYYIGKEVGFGEDLFHYYQAFDWISSNSILYIIKNFQVVTSLTGSGEPLFWIFIKLISYATIDSFNIHVILTFIGLLFIYIAGNIWKNCGIFFVFFYVNTITFFAYQGSAIRAGLALAFLLFAYSCFLSKKNKNIIYFAPFIHFSSIPLTIVIYSTQLNFKKLSNLFKLFVVSLFVGIIFTYISISTKEGGLGAKIDSKLSVNNSMDISSILQFLFESFITFILLYIYRKKIDKSINLGFVLFFVLSILILFVSPSSFSRFYRYECIFMIFIYCSILFNSDKRVGNIIIFLSFLWFIFLAYTRFSQVFSSSFLDFISYNLIYIY